MHRFFMWIVCFVIPVSMFAAVRGAHHHYFALEGDYVYLKRKNSRNRSLVKITGDGCGKTAGQTLITSNNLVNDMGSEPGFRGNLKIFYGNHSTWVLSYTGLLNWQGKKSADCTDNLSLPGTLGLDSTGFIFADHAKTIYRSNFYTIDLTYLRHVTPRYSDHFSVSWMMGLRYLEIKEKLNLYFTKGDETSTYRVKTWDWALGPFIGTDLEYNPYSFLTWGVTANLGGCFNRGEQKTRMIDTGEATLDFSPSSSNFGYFAQVYPFIEYHPVKFFTFRISYEMLYVGRVILADYQLSFSSTKSHVNHDGHVIYHGLFGGIQFNF